MAVSMIQNINDKRYEILSCDMNKKQIFFQKKKKKNKKPLDESDVESEKVGLMLNIQKTKIMTSSPITSWETDGETVETVSDFIIFFI